MAAVDPPDRRLGVSLDDYLPPSPPLTQENPYDQAKLAHSAFRSEESETEENVSVVSVGGYSPPAWKRLGNGDRSSGFWRRPDTTRTDTDTTARYEFGGFNATGRSRETSPELEDSQLNEMLMDGELDLGSVYGNDDEVLDRAVRTRLPTGSLSPEKERSPEPEFRRAVKRETIPEEDEKGIKDFLAGATKDVDNCELNLGSL